VKRSSLKLRPAFPAGPPTWPRTIPRPPEPSSIGIDYDTSWARRYGARLARAIWVDDVLRPLAYLLASPRVHGAERVAELDGPVIFAANHQSHLDTPLILAALPKEFRHRAVVAAAADYFFTSRARGAFSAMTIGAVPVERQRVNRRSSDQLSDLLGEGWNLVIFPEGTRSPDGWGQEFRGGAAYLAVRTGRPVVPVYTEGTRDVLPRDARWPTPKGNFFARTAGCHILFGPPLRPAQGEDARRFSARIQTAVATLGDEWRTDWWSARRRAAGGATPALTGPTASPWRRAWELGE
jgi:1-acyl-sn-glycerol-3-phosphate acyltransferase